MGHLGRHHVRIYSTFPSVTIVGVTDTDTVRGHAIANEFNVSFFATLDELLPHVDAVSVAVPTSSHFSIVQSCLKENCHVLVEKPIASNEREGEDLVSLAKEKGKILQVGHVERFNPIIEQIRPIIQQPGFIECHRLSPFQLRGTDVDVVRDLMIHDLDLILSLNLGSRCNIEARGMSVFTEHPDIATVRIMFESGCLVNLTASRISTGRLRKMRIYQSNCYISLDLGAKNAVVNTCQISGTETREVQSQSLSASTGDALTSELDCFIQSILGATTNKGVSGQEGVEALRMASHIVSLIHSSMVPSVSSERAVCD